MPRNDLSFKPSKVKDNILVLASCRMCSKQHIFDLPKVNVQSWLDRNMLIQNAFPKLSREERELLISGTCGKCFTELFGEGEK